MAGKAAMKTARFGLGLAGAERGERDLGSVLKALQSHAARQRFERNALICSEGDAARTIYKIVSGTVRLCRHMADGRRHIADFLLPGDIFGLAEGGRQPFTAEAISDLSLIAYPRVQFDRMAEESALVRANLLAHLSENLAAARYHHFVLGCQNSKERVMSFLIRLAARSDVFAGDHLELPMGRQDIADHLGLTIETVSRAIGALKAEGAISLPSAHEIILNSLNHRNAVAA
jgi:CRP/FNR family nitrogen fixation transcriptional regulator